MINDIYGFRMPGAFEAVANSDCTLCIMHMQGEPHSMQLNPVYHDVVTEVRQFFENRIQSAKSAGIHMSRIVLDPGYGFGKTFGHNIELLSRQNELLAVGFPLLAGLSRKSMLGQIVAKPVGDRMYASVSAALLAAQRGASFIRVHDVAATQDVLAVWNVLEQYREGSCD